MDGENIVWKLEDLRDILLKKLISSEKFLDYILKQMKVRWVDLAKSKTPSYILTLRLKTEKHQEDIINKRLEIGRQLYNSVLGIALKRYRLMLESKDYNKIKKELKKINNIYHNTGSKKEKNNMIKKENCYIKN